MQLLHVGYGNLVGSRGRETGRTSRRAAIIVNALRGFIGKRIRDIMELKDIERELCCQFLKW